ncbi:hypothetical protein [Haloarcula litorea]|uniref:hypothetical protein n=1 Tax=Haloarcula litorea TaxID=3032579 RepID=UPI0023E77A1A|nr:hypothetical protein [Halomicroarcula sp. GDY20]
MSVADRLLAGETVEPVELRRATVRGIFGDRVGVALALGSLVWFGLTWRLGFASNDQYTFANTLLALVDGHLHITSPVYGPASGATPGTHLVDGRVYGRNYGIVAVSALWYVPLRALAVVLDVRVLLTGCWGLAVAGLGTAAGSLFGRRRTGLWLGTAVGGVAFAASVPLAEPLSTYWLPLVALQLTTALAAALLAVVAYRLLGRVAERPVAVAGGVAVAAATPVGFWATLPKRHSVTALLVVCAAHALLRSREAGDRRTATRFRALAYVPPALAAWVHAPEGFVLLVALAVADLPTARWNGPRELLTVGTAFCVALLPFLLTNYVVSGNPVAPPRFLADYTGGVLGPEGDVSGAVGTDPSGRDGGPVSLPVPGSRVLGRFAASYAVLLDPDRLFRVFVRTGYVPSLRPDQDAAINLSVLASMPLLGAAVAYPVLVARRIGRDEWPSRPREWSPARVVDAFTAVYAVLLLGLFLASLPLHHMLTVRYLHPLYPLGVYWLARLPAVRGVVTGQRRRLAASYGATIVAGVPAFLGAVVVGHLVLPEAVQAYALAALAVAAVVACWSVVATVTGRGARAGAVVLGLAAGATTTYLLVAGLSLFPSTGEFLLPLSRAAAEHVHYAELLGSSPPA